MKREKVAGLTLCGEVMFLQMIDKNKGGIKTPVAWREKWPYKQIWKDK